MDKKTKTQAEFEWPEFTKDSKRISAYSQRYKDLSIADAFSKHYNMSFEVPEMVNLVPQELRVGDRFNTHIEAIDKSRVTFYSANYKANIQSTINLHKYAKFKDSIPLEEIPVIVTRVNKDEVLVDPIAPLIGSWLNPILTDPTIQKVIPNDKTGAMYTPVIVKDLQLVRGGFVGKAVVPTASEFVGEDYTIPAFIPGSQIVLNITKDFDQFIGKTVETFIMNYIPMPGVGRDNMSLICSAKELIKFKGECNIVKLFDSWCEGSDLWKEASEKPYLGRITGVINTSKKCGVFVEIPELSITGMVQTKPEELVNYKPHTDIEVKLSGFEEDTYFDPYSQQLCHNDPYVIENGVLKKCNVKPILKF